MLKFVRALLAGLLLVSSSAHAVGLITQSGPRLFVSEDEEQFTYTATHYVTADSDGGDGSIGNPWTFAEAVANASGSAKVQVEFGVYTVTPSSDPEDPVLEVVNDGTSSGDPLVFFCEAPGAYNRSDAGSQCEIRSNNSAIPSAVLGCKGGIDHVVFDGFTIRQVHTPPRPSTGTMFCGPGQSGTASTDIHFRRNYFVNEEQPDGDNYASIIGKKVTGLTITDNYFEGGNGAGEGDAATMYGVWDFVIEYNTCSGTRMCFYAKGSVESATRWNYGVIRYNYAEDVDKHVWLVSEVEPGQFIDIYQNVCLRCHAATRGDPAGIGPTGLRVYNNTFVNAVVDPQVASVGWACSWFDGAVAGTLNRFYNNIVAFTSTTTTVALIVVEVSNPANYFTLIDYNVYWNNGSTLYFVTGQDQTMPGDAIQLAAWRTAMSDEANSQGVNPSFVNAAGGNFRLNGGSAALTAGNTGGPVGAYITGSEEIGIRAAPTY